MVSYPDSHDTRSFAATLPVRRPPSATSSRASTVRQHRHRSHRSHFGGSSYTPQNEFPVFTHTGDVEILVKSRDGRREQRYLLHRLILTQCSGFFEAGTSDEWSRATIESADAHGGASGSLIRANDAALSGGQKKRWRYELDWGMSDDDVPMLVQKVKLPLFWKTVTATLTIPFRLLVPRAYLVERMTDHRQYEISPQLLPRASLDLWRTFRR
jgi:hypothetical protein